MTHVTRLVGLMTTFDIVLVLIIAGCFVVGFLWGVIRSLLMLGGLVRGVPARRAPVRARWATT